MKKILYFVLVMFIAMYSCSKDDSSDDKSQVESDKQAIDETIDNMGSDFGDIMETEGMKAMQSYSTLGGDAIALKSTGDSKNLRSLLPNESRLKAVTGSEEFNAHCGTYTWNATNQGWVYDSLNPSNKIIVNFPTDTNNQTNLDGVLTINDYSEQMFVTNEGIYMDTSYCPTSIMADLKVDGTTYIDFSFTASWANADMPTSLTASLDVNPYSFSIAFTDGGTSITASANISLNSTTLFGLSGSVLFYSSSKDSAKYLSNAVVTYRDLQLKGNVDIDAMNKAENTSQANTALDISLYHTGGSKIADIVMVDVTTDSTDVYLEYSDGSQEPASKYGESLANSIEEDAQKMDNFFNSK
jgi:hypothetical protein